MEKMGSRLGRIDPIFGLCLTGPSYLGSTDGEGTCMKTVPLSRRSTKGQYTSCHHRRGATTGDKSRGMAVFGPLRLALEPLVIPLSRLRTQPQGWGRLLKWDIASRAGEVGARHLPRDPPSLSLLEGFRPWQQSKRGESSFPSSLSSEGREPGPLDPDASTWPRTIGTSSACSLLANPYHLFPSFPRQARNQS